MVKHIMIPPEFRDVSDYCSGCCEWNVDWSCGHFGDARDFYGPLQRINWMRPSNFNRQEYLLWVFKNFKRIRYYVENPEMLDLHLETLRG